MSLRDMLETFELQSPRARSLNGEIEEVVESVKAAAYEAGYASGWEDAKAAEDNSKIRIEAEFERNIEALSFTYHEAVDRVRGEMKAFVDAFLEEFLPELMPDVLREHLRVELIGAAEERLDQPVEIVASPDCAKLVTELIEANSVNSVKLIEDASLTKHQVFVRVAEREKEINLEPLVSQLQNQLSALSESNGIDINND